MNVPFSTKMYHVLGFFWHRKLQRGFAVPSTISWIIRLAQSMHYFLGWYTIKPFQFFFPVLCPNSENRSDVHGYRLTGLWCILFLIPIAIAISEYFLTVSYLLRFLGVGPNIGLKLSLSTNVDSYVSTIRSNQGMILVVHPPEDYADFNKVTPLPPGIGLHNYIYANLIESDASVCFTHTQFTRLLFSLTSNVWYSDSFSRYGRFQYPDAVAY